MCEAKFDLISKVLGWLDVDEEAADHLVDLESVDGVELVYEDLWDCYGVEAINAEAELFYVEVYVFGTSFDLCEYVEDEDADAFQETTVFGSEDVEEEQIDLFELVHFILVVFTLLLCLCLRDYLMQIEWLERSCGKLAILVRHFLADEEKTAQFIQQIQILDGLH